MVGVESEGQTVEHVVFFVDPLGVESFRRFATRDDALRFVEHLRNDEAVEQVSLHVATEVPLTFRSYVRAEVMDEPVPYPRTDDRESAEAARVAGDVDFFTN